MSEIDLENRQVGGADPAPIDLDANSVIMHRHFVEVTPCFRVRVGVFRFVPTDNELEVSASERDRINAIERVVLNVYDYIRNNFSPEDHVQVDVESNDFTMGGVTSALVQVSHADPLFLLHRMENVI